jgi:hypothetical protein
VSGGLTVCVCVLGGEYYHATMLHVGQPGFMVMLLTQVAGLVWSLMCDLRGRPLPGDRKRKATSTRIRGPTGSRDVVVEGCLGLAIDIRRNMPTQKVYCFSVA